MQKTRIVGQYTATQKEGGLRTRAHAGRATPVQTAHDTFWRPRRDQLISSTAVQEHSRTDTCVMAEDSDTDSDSSTEQQTWIQASQATSQSILQTVLANSDIDNTPSVDTTGKLRSYVTSAIDVLQKFLHTTDRNSQTATSRSDSNRESIVADTKTGLLNNDKQRQVSNQELPQVITTQCQVAGNSPTMLMKPRTFDGTGSWPAYKLHFRSCADANHWTEEQSCVYLRTRLTGDAALVLAQAQQRTWDLSTLLGALDIRYGDAAPAYVIKSRIRKLKQGEHQTFSNYADELATAAATGSETNCVDERAILEQFKYGLYSSRVQQYVYKHKPATIMEAIKLANNRIAIDAEFPCDSSNEQVDESRAEYDRFQRELDRLSNVVANLEKVEPTVVQSACAYVDSTAPSAVAAAKPALPTVEMHRQLTPTAANSGNLFSDGNREPEATKHSHHVRLPPTGKKKQRARFAQLEQPATFTEDSSNNSDDSSVAEMGAATEADLRTLTSGRSSDSNTKIAAVKQTLAKDYDPGESYYVWGELHKDVPAVLFVVDTGAMVSMINKAVFDDIPLAQQPEIKRNYMELKSVTTQEVPTHGIVTLTVNVQGKFLEHDFWLCDMSESGVIGMDLLRKHHAMIDLAHDKLILGDKLIRVSNSKGQRVHSKIVARTATVVPPGREMVIPAKVYNKRTRGRTGFQACAMVEPARGIHRQTGAIVARVLVAANKAEVPVRVFNPCDKPITISKFTMLGKLNTPEGIRHYQHPDEIHALPDDPAIAAINKVTATSGVAATTTPKEGNPAATPAQQHLVAVAGVNVPAHLKTLYEQSTQQLKEEHKQMVAKLLCDYSDVFAKSPTDLGKTHLVQHTIDTGQEKPIQERVRRFPYEQSKEIEQQVKTMKEQGII